MKIVNARTRGEMKSIHFPEEKQDTPISPDVARFKEYNVIKK